VGEGERYSVTPASCGQIFKDDVNSFSSILYICLSDARLYVKNSIIFITSNHLSHLFSDFSPKKCFFLYVKDVDYVNSDTDLCQPNESPIPKPQNRIRTWPGAWNESEKLSKNLSVPNKTPVGRVPGVCFFMVTCSILYVHF
jgi:hypothetical protein